MIDARMKFLSKHGFSPAFLSEEDAEDVVAPEEPFRREAPKVGRNDPCPCGSGKKYKKCCMGKADAG